MAAKNTKCCCGCEAGYCEGCCGKRFTETDWPATIYADVVSALLGVINITNIPLTRFFLDVGLCPPDRVHTHVVYASPVMEGVDSGPGTDETCCFWIVVTFTCSDPNPATDIDAECVAEVAIFWTVGDGLAVSAVPVPYNCTFEFAVTHTAPNSPACISFVELSYTITIKETSSGGGGGTICSYECCDDKPFTLYATIESDCALLDGLVVQLDRTGADGWEGLSQVGDSCETVFVTYVNSWHDPSVDCAAAVSIGCNGGTCITMDIITNGAECPPHTFDSDSDMSGAQPPGWGDLISSSCNCCGCLEGDHVTVTVSA